MDNVLPLPTDAALVSEDLLPGSGNRFTNPSSAIFLPEPSLRPFAPLEEGRAIAPNTYQGSPGVLPSAVLPFAATLTANEAGDLTPTGLSTADDPLTQTEALTQVATTGTLRGLKWNDANANGIRDGSQGRIVVSHNVNTLSTSIAGEQETVFATNVAEWLIGEQGGSILAIESNSDRGRDYAPGIESALTDAGFDLTVTQETDFSLSELQAYDAVFLGQTFPMLGVVDNQALIDYVNSGGSVYLYAGVGPNAIQEAANWDEFLNAFGLDFANQYNDVFSGTFTSDHPIFDGVETLASSHGLSVIDLEPNNLNNQIVQSRVDGTALYGFFDPTADTRFVEQGLAGVSIYIDLNNNGTLDETEPIQVTG